MYTASSLEMWLPTAYYVSHWFIVRCQWQHAIRDVIYDPIDAIASYAFSISILAFVWRGKGSIFHFLLPKILR